MNDLISELMEGVKVETIQHPNEKGYHMDIWVRNVPYFFLYEYYYGRSYDLETIIAVTRGDLTEVDYKTCMECIEKMLPNKFHDWVPLFENIQLDKNCTLRVDFFMEDCETD